MVFLNLTAMKTYAFFKELLDKMFGTTKQPVPVPVRVRVDNRR